MVNSLNGLEVPFIKQLDSISDMILRKTHNSKDIISFIKLFYLMKIRKLAALLAFLTWKRDSGRRFMSSLRPSERLS